MTTLTTPIIPTHQTFAKVKAPHELNLEAICVFVAIGFFLDTDTYWKDRVVLSPASKHSLDDNGFLLRSEPWFTWHDTPKEISFNDALESFSELFEAIIKEQTHEQMVILPLSGGLDSRTQAAALKHLNTEVFSYSYSFKNGYPEAKIGKHIAKVCKFEFEDYIIPNGYLWSVMDDLSKINGCYSDFTSPRQMAVIEKLADKGEVFSLGHWGDVLFDSMNLPQLSLEKEVEVLMKKLFKRGGLELAQTLWIHWGLQGNFADYFRSRLLELLSKISIEDTNAKLRAFKSMYWAPRYTSVNLSVFESIKSITLPYYNNQMCLFICNIPDDYLKNRALQIAYIKRRNPQLAKITWQDQRPFHLNNYHLNRMPYNLPYRIFNKLYRSAKSILGKPYIQRNWELQFVGLDNQEYLKKPLFELAQQGFVSKEIVESYYNAFKNGDRLANAHAINMLLVLSKFNKNVIHA
ncbi:asparagine synthase-related protein [Aestuariivivens marinum]|uniref:asparagine synthase-related protein n=1 Tax=Aestuariivivens marinum TaxID=2913555 RepID=UPI001F5A2C4C|nr:asparagine synthase-related protein [Aestuariivivens marinum]